jgi:membrane-bound lytic murein transglycosylase B
VAAGGALADRASDRWVQSFWSKAKAAGISRQVYDAAMAGFDPDPTVLKSASNQAEFVRPIWDYLDAMLSARRLDGGQEALRRYGRLLEQIEARYGVDRYILLAIWGVESSYGAALENNAIIKNCIRSLATLAYQGGSRKRYGEQQLLAALKIIQRGDIAPHLMTSSWAGAMGHTQFIPTTYEAYAVDFDGDGRRNVWSSPADALASAANYLAKAGWETGKTWGYEVRLPRGFDFRIADSGEARTLGEWERLGLRRTQGSGFPRPGDEARLLVPAGANGPAFLMLKNFRVIKRYNNADSYALAVGHLADRLRGYGTFAQDWPREELPLDRSQRMELQRLLAAHGLYGGAIDAKIGGGTRAAIRSFQHSAGLVADGYASVRLLQQLRAIR